ncbi:hypothetical protein ACPF04_06545 [Campylobacter sp. MOP51]|uniref:hypothetical protein n=1 Tax=Campylobacter canis TaxID=3378588 RepID=UPI003C408EE8
MYLRISTLRHDGGKKEFTLVNSKKLIKRLYSLIDQLHYRSQFLFVFNRRTGNFERVVSLETFRKEPEGSVWGGISPKSPLLMWESEVKRSLPQYFAKK